MLYAVLSNMAIVLCFVPLLLLWFKKLLHEKTYLFTALYWTANGIMNMPEWLGLSQNHVLQYQVTLLYNLLDAPMVLLVFLFSSTGKKRKYILLITRLFILFELIMLVWKGYNISSSTVIIGVGAFLAITLSIIGVLEYLQKIEHTSNENTMVFIYASFLFAYGIFIVIYLFSYLKIAESEPADNFFIYYISVFLSSCLTCFGFWRYAGKAQEQPTGSIRSLNR